MIVEGGGVDVELVEGVGGGGLGNGWKRRLG